MKHDHRQTHIDRVSSNTRKINTTCNKEFKARCQTPSSASATRFRLAEPTLPPGATHV